MLHAVEKTFLVAQPVQLVALTSPEACYWAVIEQWRPYWGGPLWRGRFLLGFLDPKLVSRKITFSIP